MQRREFLKAAAATTMAATVDAVAGGIDAAEQPPSTVDSSTNPPRLPSRPYGRAGIKLSIIGFGGIVVMNADPDHAKRHARHRKPKHWAHRLPFQQGDFPRCDHVGGAEAIGEQRRGDAWTTMPEVPYAATLETLRLALGARLMV